MIAAVFWEIFSKAADSCSVKPESFRALVLEVSVRLQTALTTLLSRSELS